MTPASWLTIWSIEDGGEDLRAVLQRSDLGGSGSLEVALDNQYRVTLDFDDHLVRVEHRELAERYEERLPLDVYLNLVETNAADNARPDVSPLVMSLIETEGVDFLRDQCRHTIEIRRSGTERLTFNVHNLILDFDGRVATVEDVLAADHEVRLPLDEFLGLLGITADGSPNPGVES